jgi:hypothetical protein
MKSKLSTAKGGGKSPPTPDSDLEQWCAILGAGSAVAEVVPPGWYTVRQLAEARGRSDCATSIVIAKLVASGRAERKVFTVKLAKHTRPVPHYRLK